MSTFIAKNALLTLAVLLAAADPCLAADGGPVGLSVRTFAVLIGAIAGLFALAWAAKKYGPYARLKRSIGLDLMDQVPAGARAYRQSTGSWLLVYRPMDLLRLS